MVVIVRYGEIGIKGQNRPYFENKLSHNIRDCLTQNNIKFDKVIRKTGRIIILTDNKCAPLKNVFGIVSFSNAIDVQNDLEQIKAAALSLYKEGTFRITSSTLSQYSMSTLELNKIIGQYIVDKTKAKVKLSGPDIEIGIEILNSRAYIYSEKTKGPGGLPIGTQGLVAVLLEDEKSIDAAILMLKRGCTVTFVNAGKDVDLGKFRQYAYGQKIKIVDEIPKHAEAVIVSDDLKNIKKRDFKLPILKPLIGKWQE